MTADTAQPLAIDGGPPVRTAAWPVDLPPEPASDRDPSAALAAGLADWLEIDSDRVTLFAGWEEAAAAALHATAPNEHGGELLVPALAGNGWPAAGQRAGLTTIPVEVDAETGAIAPRAVADAIAASSTIRAVIATHPFGHPAALTELERVIRSPGLPVIEDASCALGASERGRPAGASGAAGLFRLGVPDDATAPFALVTPRAGEPAGEPAGDLDGMVARHALAWLRAEPEAMAVRRRIAWELTFGLRGMRGVAGMHHGRHVRVAYHQYIARLRRIVWKRPFGETLGALRAEGIACEAAFPAPPLHTRPGVRAALGEHEPRLASDHFTVAERLPAEWIALPLAATSTQREVDDVVAALRKIEAAGT